LNGNLELRPLERRLGLRSGSGSGSHIRLPQSKIKGLPRYQPADRASPRCSEVVRTQNRTGDGWNNTLRQEHPENIIPGRSIDLRQCVHTRQVGGSSELDTSGYSVDLLLGNSDRRIIPQSGLNGLSNR
jgi:hypothetical protein